MMRRFAYVRMAALPMILVLAACSVIQPPTPTIVGPTLTPSNTPIIQIVVTVGTPERTNPPTWTPRHSVTPVPTLTKGPTATVPSTATPVPTATIVGGKPGILTTDGQLALEITDKEINSALADVRDSIDFSAKVNVAPKITLSDSGTTLHINFNDHSQTGMVADIDLLLLPAGKDVLATIMNFNIQGGSGQLNGDQSQIVRDIMRDAFERALPPRIKPLAPDLRSYQVLRVSVNVSRILVTLKVVQATLSPTEFTATAAASIAPSKKTTETPNTATVPPKTITPVPSATQTPQVASTASK